jgi:hypothetical protein
VTHTFCDDFDGEDGGLPRWTSATFPSAPSTLGIDPMESVSPPSSLRVNAPSEGEIAAYAQKTFDGSMYALHCELDFRHDPQPSGEGASPILAVISPSSTVAVVIGSSSQLSTCPHTPTPCDPVSFTGPAAGQWSRLVLELSPVAGSATLAIGAEGENPAAVGTTYGAGVPDFSGAVTLELGIASPENQTGPLDLHVDNVWCDVTPN